MTCQTYQARLDELEDYIEGRLDAAVRAGVESHLAACNACREAVEAAREAVALLQAAELERAPEPGLGFWTRLAARIRAEEASAADFWRSLEAFSWRMTWAAGVLLVLLGGYLLSFDILQNHSSREQMVEFREVFPEPPQPTTRGDVLLSLTTRDNGR